MNQPRRTMIFRLLGISLLLIGALLLTRPYLENAYLQWRHPVSEKKTPAVSQPQPSLEKKVFKPIEGRLVIPSLNLDLRVGYGVEEADLKKGPGFYPQSSYPSSGNVSIAGHRNAYGSPFLYLDKLQPGDIIELYYDQQHFVYTVEKVFVTNSSDWSVIDPTNRPAITLTTCTPLQPVNGHYDRLIIRGYLQN